MVEGRPALERVLAADPRSLGGPLAAFLALGTTSMMQVGRDVQFGRGMYLAAVSSAEDVPVNLDLPTKYFCAMLVWDSEGASVDSISRLVESLFRSGCVYMCCWGSGYDRVHDIADDVIVAFQLGLMDTRTTDAQDLSATGAEGRHIMTTGHGPETLEEALHFFLTHTRPGSEYEGQCGSAVVLAIGQQAPVVERIRTALLNPQAFRTEIEDIDHDGAGAA